MKFITRSDLQLRGVRFTNKHLLFLEREGRFPKRVKLGHSRVVWVEAEIEAHLIALADARSMTPRLDARAGYITK